MDRYTAAGRDGLSANDEDPLRYSWKVTDTFNGKRRTHVLRWKMSKAQALDWSSTRLGVVMELVPLSGENPSAPIELRSSGGCMRTPGFGD